jgi:hypothetical protein
MDSEVIIARRLYMCVDPADGDAFCKIHLYRITFYFDMYCYTIGNFHVI